ncbi:hypothetical protein CEXT_560601 [Caerostris extrusa]|uniref:Uncharacterized protein n=1 Tax=Caerostris extrusa TaxID=172846 RepID=A0AAV4MCH0_CAEEX|nr:hypothetical protein CEXT_560601 [Caerostris extrusa]
MKLQLQSTKTTTTTDSGCPLSMHEWAVRTRRGRGAPLTSSGHWWVAQLIDENPVVESLQWLVDCDVCLDVLLRVAAGGKDAAGDGC